MVPAPTTAALFTGICAGIFRNARNLRHFAVAEKDVDQRFGLVGEQAFLEQFGFALDAFVERKLGGGFHSVNGSLRRHQIARFLAGGIPGESENRSIRLFVAQLPVQIARAAGRCADFGARECHRALQQIAVHNLIHDAGFESGRGAHRIARGAHFHRFRDTGQPRQTLCSGGARDNPELHFRLTHLRRGNRHPIVACHRGFQSSTERGAVNRRHNRLGIVFHAVQYAHEAGSLFAISPGRDFPEFADVRAGDERSASADQHNRLYRVIFFEFIEAGDNSFRHARTQGVYRRVIDGEDTHFAVFARKN